MFTLLNTVKPLPSKIQAHHERDQPNRSPLDHKPSGTERKFDYTGHGYPTFSRHHTTSTAAFSISSFMTFPCFIWKPHKKYCSATIHYEKDSGGFPAASKHQRFCGFEPEPKEKYIL